MNFNELGDGMMDALERFDKTVLPLGLYASDELVEGKQVKPRYQEWKGAILPYLSSQGCSASGFSTLNYQVSQSSFDMPDVGVVGLVIVKFSNIKVRKYGSGYHVDKHEDRAHRWKRIDLSGHISSLWKQPETYSVARQAKVLLFIGFDKAQRPLERELVALQQSLKWEQKDVAYQTRTWQDKAERGFGVRLSVWSRLLNGR